MRFRKSVTLIGDLSAAASQRGGGWSQTRYRMGAHETLEQIARSYLGSSTRAGELAALNPHARPGALLAMPPDAIRTADKLGLIVHDASANDAPDGAEDLGFLGIGPSADDVRLFANQVDAQIHAIDLDVIAAATDPSVRWDMHVGTAWETFKKAWRLEYEESQVSNSPWQTWTKPFLLGLGDEYDRIATYQEQAKDWQKTVAQLRGKPSSIPTIVPQAPSAPIFTPDLQDTIKGVAAAAGVVALAWVAVKILDHLPSLPRFRGARPGAV